jgi:hypothetical protein
MQISRIPIAAGSKLLSGLRRKEYKENHVDDAKSFTDEIKEIVYADVAWVKAAADGCWTFVDLSSIPATL